MTVDSWLFATLAGRYHDRDVALFQVSETLLAKLEDGSWSVPVALRLVREEGAMVTIELQDLHALTEIAATGSAA